MALGVAAATPGLMWAGPLSFLQSKSAPAAKAAPGRTNKDVLNDVVAAFKEAGIKGKGLNVEVNGGVVKLTGAVAGRDMRAVAAQTAASINGVRRVDNQLKILEAAPSNGGGIQQVQHRTAPRRPSNDQMAAQVASALEQAQLAGADIDIQCQSGIVRLTGAVASTRDRAAASAIVGRLPGVQQVENNLQVTGGLQAANFQDAAAPVPGGPYAAATMPRGAMAGMAPIPAYGYPGGGASQVVFDQPNMPNYAWPAYAQYPNMAAVTYPQQYSASAWPYIGPFYPYPQVPLGWRKVQLEWDDGYWQLNFRPRTEKWWWFLNYKNW
jgi:osmotically-inducible protein OsmY